MEEREFPGGRPKGDEAPDEGVARAGNDGKLIYPAVGPNAKFIHDKESQARRPEEDTSPTNVDGDPDSGGTPPGTSTRGA